MLGKLKEAFEDESFDRILVDAPCSGFRINEKENQTQIHKKSQG